ncbi:MAG: cell division protein ZapA [Bacteroidia bacterium]|nr:cell division protein ZapA [Bacteroidia bacterium]
MDQSITLTIDGRKYPLKVSSPEMEEVLRSAAEDMKSMLNRYTEKFPDKTLEDKLVFVTLQETVQKITAQRKLQALSEEVSTLSGDMTAYLKETEK